MAEKFSAATAIDPLSCGSGFSTRLEICALNLNMKMKHNFQLRQAWLLAGALIWILGLNGCGGPSAVPADHTDGRKALVTALDTWKSGEKPAALAQKTPSIHVADGDWNSGLQLVDYQADDEGKHFGSDLNYKVVLELKNTKGKVSKKNATYAVSTHPVLMVLRQDD